MAIVDELIVPQADAPAVSGPRTWPRLLFGFVVGVVLAAGIAAGGLYAWDASYEGRILPGVHAGGVDLTGMDRNAATNALTAAYEGYGTGSVVIGTEDGDVSVPYAQFGRRIDVGPMVDAALGAGRLGTPLQRAAGEIRLAMAGREIEPGLVLDEAALAADIDAVLAPLERAPVDAAIVKGPQDISTVAEREGRAFDANAVAASALDAVRRLDAPAEVRVEAAAIPIRPSRGNEEVLSAKAAAERMIGGIVVRFGDRHWTIRSGTVRSWITFDTVSDGSVQPVADEAAVKKALAKVAKGVRREPLSATYLRAPGGKIVGVAAGKNGRQLDASATAHGIMVALAARAYGAAPKAVSARVAPVVPRVTTAEALRKGPLMVQLGMWKTWFPVSERNFFGANIWLPAKIIDGTVLYPGQRFEWWSRIGSVSPSRGFGPGGFIAGDHTEPTGALGGGMCSSSTTLFNAAMRAGLRMGARSNHKYYIYRYPLGLDATVSKMPGGGGQTMSFTNDMKHPVVIRSLRYTAGGLGWVRYEIWGIPDGRTVSLSRPSVANVSKATTSTVYTSRLPHGVKEQVEYPANGMDVSVTRTVRDRNGRVIDRNTWHSHYVLWNGRVEIGR